jgi:hypothetical protein
MAAPPPGACEEERCQWSRSCWEIHAVQRRIHERLRRTAGRSHQPELADPPYPYYQRRLYRHLQRMPARYLADVDLDGKAEDVRLHWRILDECADPSKRPVFHARYLKVQKKNCYFLNKIFPLYFNIVDAGDFLYND